MIEVFLYVGVFTVGFIICIPLWWLVYKLGIKAQKISPFMDEELINWAKGLNYFTTILYLLLVFLLFRASILDYFRFILQS